MVIGSQRTGEGSGGIAVNQHYVRLFLRQHLIQSVHSSSSDVKQSLTGSHNIKVVVRLNIEEIQHLVKHFTMLGSNGSNRDYLVGMLHQLQYNRSHLYCLRTGTENSHYFKLLVHNPSLILLNNIIHSCAKFQCVWHHKALQKQPPQR